MMDKAFPQTTTLAILHAIASNPEGLSFTEMQLVAFKRAHPNREFTRDNRGWWCAPLTGANGHAFRGYITKDPTSGRYHLSGTGSDKLFRAMLGKHASAGFAPKTNKRSYWVTVTRTRTDKISWRVQGCANAGEAQAKALAEVEDQVTNGYYPHEPQTSYGTVVVSPL